MRASGLVKAALPFLLLWASVITYTSCMIPVRRGDSGGSGSAPAPNPQGWVRLRGLIPSTLHFRRPAGPGADPAVGPGGPDYQSNPRPGARWDCESWPALFREISLKKVSACLALLNDRPRGIRYSLQREAQPYLLFESVEDLEFGIVSVSKLREGAPEISAKQAGALCLLAELPRIPVPREIFFQNRELEPPAWLSPAPSPSPPTAQSSPVAPSPLVSAVPAAVESSVPSPGVSSLARQSQGGGLPPLKFAAPSQPDPVCYSRRLPIEEDEVLGIKIPFLRQRELKIDFPLEGFLAAVPESTSPPLPQPLQLPLQLNDEQVLRLLLSWALTPFFDGEQSGLSSRVVPDAICSRCIEPARWIGPGAPPSVHWP